MASMACLALLVMVAPVHASEAGSLFLSHQAWGVEPGKLSPAGDMVRGPYTSKIATFTNPAQDSSNRSIHVVYPAEEGSFPLIVYAHGLENHADEDYQLLFDGLVSFGYIVMAPLACFDGCKDDKKHLPWDPAGFGNYYKQQLLVIQWAKDAVAAKTTDPVLSKLNVSLGVGIAGHSMGGQATLFSSSFSNASDLGIAAAVMHHAYTHEYPAPQVPFLAFTGSHDDVASQRMTKKFFGAAGANAVKGIVDSKKFAHFEPEDNWLPWKTYNPLIPQFTAAWFKLQLEKKTSEFGVDFKDMIYGKGNQSLCGSGDGSMVECDIRPSDAAIIV